MNVQDGFQLNDIVGMLRRRALPAAFIAGATVLFAIFVAAILPNRYQAWTTLLVEPQTISDKIVEAGMEKSDLNSRLHLMTMQILSRGRLSKVIDDLQLYAEESQSMTREEVISLMRSHVHVEPVLPELEANERFTRRDQVEINTFQLFFRADSPRIAADVANRLANDFIEEHIKERVQVSGDSAEFVAAELERLASQIQSVEQRIAEVKNENAGRLPEDHEANQRLLERAMGDLRLGQRDLAIAESDAAFYRQQAVTGASSGYRTSLSDTPAERKQRLELELGAAQARGLTEKHPDVVAIREELAGLEGVVGDPAVDEEQTSPEQSMALNEAKRAELRAQSARAEIARMDEQVNEAQDRLAAIPRVAEQLSALEREHEHLFKSYQEYSGKQLAAGVAANMERRQKGEQFRILEAAFPPASPSSPNRLIIIALGVLMGLAFGAASALLLETADTSFHRARQVQATLGVPVLASVPQLVLASDHARILRRRILAGVVSASVAGVVLAGAGAGYVAVNGAPGFVRTLLGRDQAPTLPPGPEPGR
jgi:polysaccharide chain length determinant protein (PEP-CTERM system associated)